MADRFSRVGHARRAKRACVLDPRVLDLSGGLGMRVDGFLAMVFELLLGWITMNAGRSC